MNALRGALRGLLLLALGLLPGLAPALPDAQGDPQQVIRAATEHLQRSVREERNQPAGDPTRLYRVADEVLVPLVDMDGVSSLVLGRHWRTATPAQREAFAAQLKRLLVRTYASALREFGDWEIRFPARAPAPEGDRVQVQAEVLRVGVPQPVAVEYSMHRREGRWLAYDLKIEGISLVTNYRSNFAELIRQKGLDGLIAELSAMNERRAPAARPAG